MVALNNSQNRNNKNGAISRVLDLALTQQLLQSNFSVMKLTILRLTILVSLQSTSEFQLGSILNRVRTFTKFDLGLLNTNLA